MLTIYYPYHAQHDPATLHRSDDDRWNRYYAEVAARGQVIYQAIKDANFGAISEPNDFGLSPIQEIHAPEMLTLLQNAHALMKQAAGRDVALPETFNLRQKPEARLHSIFGQLGHYCFDTSVPIFANTWQAAYWSAQTAVSAAAFLLAKQASAVYALCRPPGHHAATDLYGGFCYLNNCAIAANWLVNQGQRIAILDIDYHHGNGTQEIFYGRPDVLFISIHADPSYDYPFYWGFADERGEGAGQGFNHNFPLPLGTKPATYLATVEKAVHEIRAFTPDILFISLGVDIGENDPTGSFLLDTPAFTAIGRQIGRLNLPTVIIQEGGYLLEKLGHWTTAFFDGLLHPF